MIFAPGTATRPWHVTSLTTMDRALAVLREMLEPRELTGAPGERPWRALPHHFGA